MERQAVWIEYRNYKGEVSWRRILPLTLEWRESEWHGWAWHLSAYDFDRRDRRAFAAKDILQWCEGQDHP